MRNDIIEFSLRRGKLQDVLPPEFDVFQARRRDRALAGVDLHLRGINAHETGTRRMVGHGKNIRPIGAPEFQDTCR